MHDMLTAMMDKVRAARRRVTRSDLGSALLVVMAAAAVLFITAAAVVGVVVFQQTQQARAQAVVRSTALAQQGMEVYLTNLRTDPDFWVTTPTIAGVGQDGTWTVAANIASSTITAVGRDRTSGILHVIRTQVRAESWADYTIVSDVPITLGNGAGDISITGGVRSNSTITLAQSFPGLSAFYAAGDVVNPGNADKVEKVAPLDFSRVEAVFPNLYTAAKSRDSWVTGASGVEAPYLTKSLAFYRDPSNPSSNYWGPSNDAAASSNVTDLVGVGIDFNNYSNASTGVFYIRSVWAPIVSATAEEKATVTQKQFVDMARQDPQWNTGRKGDLSYPGRTLSITPGGLNPNGNNVIYVGGPNGNSNLDVYVKGDYFRSVTIVSERDIYIIGDVKRSTAPGADPNATLGLVAKGNIYICGAMPNGTGNATYNTRDGAVNGYSGKSYTRGSTDPKAFGETLANNVTIQASLMAVEGAVIMDPEDLTALPASMRPAKRSGTLTIEGSLIARQGLKGPNFANEYDAQYGGFARTVIGFDARTNTTPPPLFPQIGAGALKVISWDEFTTDVDPNAGLTFPPPGVYGPTGPVVDNGEELVIIIPPGGDDIAPTTDANVPATGAVFNGQAVITLDVSDKSNVDGASSAIWKTWYRIDADPTVYVGRTIVLPPLPDNSVATRTVTYWSQDVAGNMEPEKTATFLMRGLDTLSSFTTVIDSQNPTKLLPDGYPQIGDPDYVVYGEFQPQFVSEDPTSGLGVEQIWVIRDGTDVRLFSSDQLTTVGDKVMSPVMDAIAPPVAGFVTHSYEYYSIDKAGNREPTKTLTMKQHAFDKVAPITYHDMVVNPLTGSAAYVGTATISMNARDDEQGQGVQDTFYQIDGGAWIQSTNPTNTLSFLTTIAVAPPRRGQEPVTHTLSYYSRDLATTYGRKSLPNVEETQTVTFVVAPPLDNDTTPPVTTSDVRPSYIGPAVIILTSMDAGGVDKIYWRLDGGPQQIGARISVDSSWTVPITHTIEFWAVDFSGNVELPHNTATFTVSPERIAPITAAHNLDLYAGPAVFQLTASDNEGGSGLAATYYKIDGGEYQLGVTTPLGLTWVTVEGDGLHTVTFYSVDHAGNAETPKTCEVRVDTTPPTSSCDATTTVYVGSASVNLTASDAGSGVAYTHWRNKADGVEQGSNPVLLGPGTWEVEYWSVDKAGNAEDPNTFNVTVTAAPDHTAPASYDDIKSYYHAGTSPAAIINLYSWDVQTGVASMNYILDGTTRTPFPGVGNPPAGYQLGLGYGSSDDGTHTIEYWAIDKASPANVETPHHIRTFKIDTILPVTTCSARAGATYWSTQTFSLQGTDAGSGIKATYYSLDGGVTVKGTNVLVSAPLDGFAHPHIIQYWSVDNAGNIEIAKSVSFTSKPLDDIAPTTFSNAAPAYQGAAIISLTARDNYGGSGVAWTKYRLDNGPETTGTLIPVAGAGPHTLKFWSQDNAGNTETMKSVTYVVDSLAPVTITDARALYNTPAVIHLTASDTSDGSSVANTFYRLDGAAVATGTPPITTISVNTTGTHTLAFWSVDGAGNAEATKTVTFKIDMTPPVTTSNATADFAGTADFTLTAVDEVGGSGVAYTYFRIDGGARITGTSVSVAGPVSGAPVAHNVMFWSVDAAGNAEDPHTVSFTVSPLAPMTFSGMYPAENGTIGIRNPVVSVTGHATVSTVASAIARIDGTIKPATITYGGGYWVYQGYWVDGYWVDGYWDTDGCDTWWVDAYYVDTYYVDTSYYVAVDYATATVTYPVAGLANGQHWASVTFTNAVGATNTKTWMFTVTAPADITAPITTCNAVAMYKTAATIKLVAADEVGGMGLAATYYKIDGGSQQTGTAPTTTVSVSTEGSHTLEYWSTDKATPANTETHKFAYFMIDMTPPVTTAGATASYAGTATVWLSARDNANGSGVISTNFKVDGGTTSSFGSGFSVTGGTQFTSGGNTVIVFNSSGNLVCNGSVTGANVLVVGGGGGGGARHGFGGGAGQYVTGTTNLSGTMSIVVGAGGAGATGGNYLPSEAAPSNSALSGQSSSALGLTATGGGAGFSSWGSLSGNGFAGGTGYYVSPYWFGAGGGGSAGVGGSATASTVGAGGPGTANNVTGTSVVYARGGSGGSYNNNTLGIAGAANTGNGGSAGGGETNAGGSGGSGIVIISFPTPSAAPALAPGTVALWHTNEGSGATVSDSSGNALHGTLTVGAGGTQTTTTQAWANGASGKFGKSLKLDGVDDYVNLGSQAALNNLESFSVGAWVKTSVNSGTQIIVGRSNAWRLVKYGSTYTFEHRNNESNNLVLAQGTNTSSDWVYVVGTFDSSTKLAKLYINGVLVDTKTQTGTTCKSWTQNMIGGNYGWHPDGTFYNDYWFNGQIDEVTISNVARSAEDIQSYYTASSGGEAPPMPVTILAPVSGAPVAHTVSYWSVDNAGNAETPKSATFSVAIPTDVTPPTTTSNAVASYLKPTTITLTAVDNPGGWGVANTYYKIDATTTVWSAGTAATTGSIPGTHTLYFYSIDAAGNRETTKSATFFLTSDSIPPVTTSNAVPTYVGPNTITLSATDVGWGVDKTYYRVDGGLTQTGASVSVTAPVDLAPRSHTLEFWSIDLAGNKETTKSANYSVSGTPAAMTYSGIAPVPGSMIKDAAPTVTITGKAGENILGASATLDGVSQPFSITYAGGYWVDNGYWNYEEVWDDWDEEYYWDYVWYPVMDWVGVDQTQGTVTFPTAALGSGAHTVSVTFNLASGAQGRYTWTFIVDLAAPTTISNMQPSYTGTATITLTPQDNSNGSGIAWTKYRVDSGPDTVGTVIVVAPPVFGSTTHTIYYWSADNVGNVETVKSGSFTQNANPDTTPPTTTSNAAASYVAPGTITLTAVDNPGGWGVAYTYYKLDGGAVTTGTAPITQVATGGSGTHTLLYWSKDLANNTEATKTATYTVNADTTPPTTTSNAVASYNGTATITLSASDNVGGWGLDHTCYTIDDGATMTVFTAVSPVVVYPPVINSVVHHIDFWSVDKANNTESKKTATFTINAIPATIVWSGWTPPVGSYNKGTVPTVSVVGQSNQAVSSATATLNGVAKTVVLTFPFTITGTTSVQVWVVSGYWQDLGTGHWEEDECDTWWVEDYAWIDTSHYETQTTTTTVPDNTKALASVSTGGLVDGVYNAQFTFVVASGAASSTPWTFYVDNLPPVTSSNATSTYTGTASITLSASDAVSGVAATYFQVDGGTVTQGTNISVAPPSWGSVAHRIDFYSVDRAGNVEAAKSATFTVNGNADGTAPTTTDNVQRWYRVISTITLTPYDAGSGAAYTKYQLYKNGVAGVLTTGTTLATGDGEGNYVLYYFSVDRAGNKETTRTAIFGVDWTPPVTTSNAVASYAQNAAITLSATDNLSGIANTYYTVDNGVLRTGTTISVPGPVAGQATHHIDFYSIDVAGNQESAKTATFTVTAAPASITWSQWTPAKLSSLTVRNPSVSVRGKALVNVTGATATIDGNAVTPTLTYPSTSTTTTTTWVTSGYWGYGPSYWQDGYWVYGHYEDVDCETVWVDTYWQDGYWVNPWVYFDTSHYVTTTSTVTDYTDVIATFPTSGLVDGTHTVSFTYTVTGGGQASESWTFKVVGPDTTPPVTTPTYQTAYIGNATVLLSAVDNVGGSGVAATYYKVDAGSFQTGTPPNTTVTIAAPAYGSAVAHSMTFYSVDVAGNPETQKVINFTVAPLPDTTPPVTTSSAVASYTLNAAITLSATDGGWGVANTYYRVDGGAQQTYTGSAFNVPGPASGLPVLHTISFWSVDRASNTETAKTATFTVSAAIDGTPPTTTNNAVAFYGVGGIVTLTAADNVGGWGLGRTFYQLDAGAITTGTAPVTSVAAGGQGTHTLYYWSVDYVGNKETTKSCTYGVDLTPPVSTLTNAGVYTTNATMTLTAVDAGTPFTGVRNIFYKIDNNATQTPGTIPATIVVAGPTNFSASHTITYWSDDMVYNYETARTATFTINATPDGIPPVTTTNAQTYYAAISTITLSPTDVGWGWAVCYLKLDSGAWTTGLQVGTGGEGTHTLQYYATDLAGNKETTKSVSYMVDLTNPVTSSNAVTTYTASAAITLSASDVGGSGVQYTKYQVDAGVPAYYYGTPFIVAGPVSGPPVQHTIYFWSMDIVGHIESPAKQATFWITPPPDVTAPSTTASYSAFYPGPSTISLTATDNAGGWGVAHTYYRLDGSASAEGNSPATGGSGQHTLEFWSVDNAGNKETTKSVSYNVDMTPPTTSSNAVSSYTGTATITLTATDNAGGSGVQYTYYKVDAGTQTSGTVITVAPPAYGSVVHTIYFWSVDKMGWPETQKSASFTVNAVTDIWAPTTIAGYVATYSKPGTITLTATDIGWGVRSINYSLDGAASVQGYYNASSGTMSASCLVGTGWGGSHTLEFWSTDNAAVSNVETPHKTITYTVTPDVTPPVTVSDAVSFYTGPATVHLTATDAGWGVQYTHYRVDSGSETSGTTITIPDTLTGTVTHTIYFWSKDWANNTESTKSATFTVKATPATLTTSTVTPPDGSTVTISNPLIRLTGSLNQNVSSATMNLDGAAVTPTVVSSGHNTTVTLNPTGMSNAVHTVDVTLTGADGRQVTRTWSFTVTVNTDFVAPTTLSNAVASYFGTATVALIATDNAGGSGVAYTKYKVDAGALTTGTLVNIAGPASGAAVSHTLYFFSVDNAGNIETTKSATFTISPKDVTAPTTTSNAQAYYIAPATILLSASDDQYGSGVAHTYYILDGAAQTEGTIVGTGVQGTHVLEFWSVDYSGNIESPHKFATYKVDLTAPVTFSDAGTNYTGTATIHLTASDNVGGSGIKSTYYVVDTNAKEVGTVITIAPPSSGSAQHTIYFWSTDNAGNIEATKTATFGVAAPPDTTPPTTTSDAKSVYPVPGLITLVALDGGWGVDKTYYKLDAGAQTEGLKIRTGGAGSHTLEFWSVDKGNNVETHHVATYTVTAADVAPPTTTSNALASYVGSATISLTATDNCGILPVTYFRVDTGAITTGTVVKVPGPRSGSAAHTLYFWSVDLNGNVEATKTANFSITMQPAGMTFSGVSPVDGSTIVVRNPVITVTAQDTQAITDVILELDSVPVVPSVNFNGNQASLSYAASALGSPGTHTAVAQFTDAAGASSTKTWTFTVNAPADVTAPVTTSDGAATYKGTAAIHLSATDDAGGSGVASTSYKIDSGSTFTSTNASTTVTISATGPHTIEFWSTDRSNNNEYPHKTLSFNVDVLAPVTTSDAQDAYSGNATIHLTANDGVGGSGIAFTYYTIDGGAQQTGAVITVPAPATGSAWHTVRWWSVDLAGNVEVQSEVTNRADVNVWAVSDVTPPVTTTDARASYTVPGVIHLTASDGAGWGVAHTYYRLDGGAQTEGTFLGTGGTTPSTHSLQYWSVDLAGNTESVHTVTYTVAGSDAVAPTTTSNAQVSYTGTANISLTATDNAGGSGVAHTYYRLDGGAQTESTLIGVSAAGAHTLQFWSVDWAGNIETAKSASFTIVPTDVTPPVTTSNALASYNGTATVSLTATDGVSGTGVRTTFYRLDGGPVQQGLSIIILPPASGAPVSHSLVFWSVDNAGNVEPDNTQTFTVAPPADSVAPTTVHNGAASYTGQAVITLTATDNTGGSGVKATYYRLDGAAQQTGTVITIPAPASGAPVAHTIQFWSVDNANNTEVAKSFSFTVGPVAVTGNATLSFRWDADDYADAQLHVENASGTWISSVSLSGYGSDLYWDVTVPAGQNYKMVCDYYYDDYYENSGGGYGTWSYEQSPLHNPLQTNDQVVWWY